MSDNHCQLYLITPENLEPRNFSNDLAAAIDAGNVACVQLRLKHASRDELAYAIDVLRPPVQERNVAFVVNDDPNLAFQTGCDGVHVGQEDMPCNKARVIMGGDAIVGVTCLDSLDLAMRAAEQGANYVAFGAFFPTNTKVSQGHPSSEILKTWSTITTVPSVAIGGIKPENCASLVSAGADFLAVVSAVWDHPLGPANAVEEFNKVITP